MSDFSEQMLNFTAVHSADMFHVESPHGLLDRARVGLLDRPEADVRVQVEYTNRHHIMSVGQLHNKHSRAVNGHTTQCFSLLGHLSLISYSYNKRA